MSDAAAARDGVATALAVRDVVVTRSVRQIDVFAPVGLEQDTVHLLELDGLGAITHSLEQRAEA